MQPTSTRSSFISSAYKPNGIHGIAPAVINAQFAHALGTAVGRHVGLAGVPAIVVGRDARLSSVELAAALQAGIRATGMKVIDVGMAPTPLVYFAAHLAQTSAAIVITGGHHPSNYNGFKVMLDNNELHGPALMALYDGMTVSHEQARTPGTRSQAPMPACYSARMQCDIRLARGLKVAIDCGNGVAGAVAPSLFRELGCEVTELFCEVDSSFPNHPPDPTDLRNLQDLVYCLRYSDCELGLAFDADAERLAVVTKSGNVIGVHQQLILFARDLLARQPGTPVVYDVQCSRHVPQAIQDAGGTPIMWKTGRALIKAKMDEAGAMLAGETSGHLFFKDRWYGFSDGLYAGARLLEILSRVDDPSALLEALPHSCSTPELKAQTGSSDPARLIDTLRNIGRFTGADEEIVVDGLRVEYPDGFGMARASNSNSALVFRFEADSLQALTRIQTVFRKQLRRVAPRLQLPF